MVGPEVEAHYTARETLKRCLKQHGTADVSVTSPLRRSTPHSETSVAIRDSTVVYNDFTALVNYIGDFCLASSYP